MIRIEALSARPSSKGKSGLSKLDFSIPARKVVGLIGPIGAGKGGLLKVLAGGQKAKEGRFYLDGEALTPKAPRWRQDVALASADLSYPSAGTVWERLLRKLESPHLSRSKVTPSERAEAVLRDLELWERAQASFSHFSPAERWRLSIALNLLSGPRCLLLEEPSSIGVDELAAALGCLASVAASGTTCVLATASDVPSAFFDELCILDGGCLVANGAPQELAESQSLPPQISIPRSPASEELVDETIMEGFVWADGPRKTFMSALPEDIRVEDFYAMMRAQGLERGFASLQPPSVGTLFQAFTGRALEENSIAH